MSSEELLTRYLTNGLLTNIISIDDFERIINEKEDNGISRDTIQTWYDEFRGRDSSEIEMIENNVDEFLMKLRGSILRDFEKQQMAESFSLGEIINNMYDADQILSSRLNLINKKLSEATSEISSFNNLFIGSNKARESSENHLSQDILDTLESYRKIIKDFDNDEKI